MREKLPYSRLIGELLSRCQQKTLFGLSAMHFTTRLVQRLSQELQRHPHDESYSMFCSALPISRTSLDQQTYSFHLATIHDIAFDARYSDMCQDFASRVSIALWSQMLRPSPGAVLQRLGRERQG